MKTEKENKRKNQPGMKGNRYALNITMDDHGSTKGSTTFVTYVLPGRKQELKTLAESKGRKLHNYLMYLIGLFFGDIGGADLAGKLWEYFEKNKDVSQSALLQDIISQGILMEKDKK